MRPESASGAATLTIVIPTRNRPTLVPNAIRSAATQAPGRVRVIVSDNSDDPSDRQALETFVSTQDPRVVSYLRAPRSPMTVHWEWALHRAMEVSASTHFGYLTDRMVLRPGFVDELLAIAERHPRDMVSYNYDTVEDTTLPAHLEMERWSGRLLAVDAGHFLEGVSRGVLSNAMPRMMNTMVPRTLLSAVRARFGSVFGSISPDVCFALRSLTVADRFLFYDKAGLIQYAIGRSQGINYLRGILAPEVVDFAHFLGGTSNFSSAPVPQFQTMLNSVFHEYGYVRAEAKSEKFAPVDPTAYFGAIAWDALTMWNGPRAKTVEAQLRAHGWNHARTLAWLLRKLVPIIVHDPGRLLEPLYRRMAKRRPFDSAEAAIAWAIAHPRHRSPGLAHLWQLRPAPVADEAGDDGNPQEEALLSA